MYIFVCKKDDAGEVGGAMKCFHNCSESNILITRDSDQYLILIRMKPKLTKHKTICLLIMKSVSPND